MKKTISYRDKLLELARIYNIVDIKSYIRSKKNLTTAQIEHILKKNKVPIPTEIHKSILEIQSKKITRPISLFVKNVNLRIESIIKKIYSVIKITKTGKIEVVKSGSPHESLNEEMKRVLDLYPKVTPGKYNGKAVDARYMIPITFYVE